MDIYYVSKKDNSSVIGRYYAYPQKAKGDLQERLVEYSKHERIDPPLTLNDVIVEVESSDSSLFRIFPITKPGRPRWLGYGGIRPSSRKHPVQQSNKSSESTKPDSTNPFSDGLC